MGQVRDGVYVGERPSVISAVTRWAPLLLAALLAAGVPWVQIPTALAVGLAQCWGESRGDPEARNKSGARGLWQFLSSDYQRELGGDWSPENQARVYARNLWRQRQRTGSWWTSGLVWASGPGAARASIEDRGVARGYQYDQIPYLTALWTIGAPLYGAWARAWLRSTHPGQPIARVERWSGVYRWAGVGSWRVAQSWRPWAWGAGAVAAAGALAWGLS